MPVPDNLTPPEGFAPIVSENPFGKAVGPIYEKKNGKDWVRGFYVAEKHSNRANIAHGGVIMTFADIVLATAVFEEIHKPFVTIQMDTQFIAPAKLGAWIEGRATITRLTSTLAFVNGKLTSGKSPVASVSGIFKIL